MTILRIKWLADPAKNMEQTSLTLLERLTEQDDDSAWQRFIDLYTPLIQRWVNVHGHVNGSDTEDLTQTVLEVVLRELPKFDHNRNVGAFRCWLRRITVNRLRAFWQEREPAGSGDTGVLQMLNELEDPHSGISRQWDHEHNEYIARRLLELVEREFETSTWEAFRRTAVEGQATKEVAKQLGVTMNAVLIAKSRVLSRLRQEMRGLIEEI
jgi:RNA polymerase sigma-70 factor (ECF subfamily)